MRDGDNASKRLIDELNALRQQYSEVLRGKEEYRELMETLPVLICTFSNKNGEILFVNKAYCDYFRKTKEDLIGSSFLDLIPEWERESVWNSIKTLNKDNPVMTHEHPVQLPGYVCWQLWTNQALMDEKGEVFGYQSFGEDITKRKRAEEELEIERNYFRSILDAMADGVYIVDQQFNIEYINPVIKDEFGPINDRKCYEYFHHLTDVCPWCVNEQVWAGQSVHWEWQSPRNNKTYELFDTPLRHVDGSISKLEIFHDITERKQLEEQLRQSQKMEALGVLAGGIAHEINNLLTPILGYTEMLLKDKSEYDPEKEILEQIRVAGDRGKEIVKQMLAYGRQSMSQRVPLQLETIVDDISKLMENTLPPDIHLTKEIDANLPPIFGMANEIHQVILNLCINASHAMPEGGVLTIRLTDDGYRKFLYSEGKYREGNFIGLSVHDTGVGMDQTTLDRIFDPFFSTKGLGQGSGLGLSVVQGIVEQHEGYIEVDSKVGEGSTFHVYFPVAQGEVKSLDVKTKPLTHGNERVLLIDDEPMITKVTRSVLEGLGYTVTDQNDCLEALKLFTEHPQDFDLVITDYGMSEMNGKQLVEKIKEIRSDISIILFTRS